MDGCDLAAIRSDARIHVGTKKIEENERKPKKNIKMPIENPHKQTNKADTACPVAIAAVVIVAALPETMRAFQFRLLPPFAPLSTTVVFLNECPPELLLRMISMASLVRIDICDSLDAWRRKGEERKPPDSLLFFFSTFPF